MKKLILATILVVAILFTFTACGTNSNDGKCDVCGKKKYAKLSDGNEYCYTHWNSALDYYLDD